jgi:hypothetical protein
MLIVVVISFCERHIRNKRSSLSFVSVQLKGPNDAQPETTAKRKSQTDRLCYRFLSLCGCDFVLNRV